MPNSSEAAAKLVAWEMQSWKSIDIRVHGDLTNHMADTVPAIAATGHEEEHYIETAAGQRFYEVATHFNKGPERDFLYYYDGTRGADVPMSGGRESRQVQVIIKKSFGIDNQFSTHHCPDPLIQFYVGGTPLHEALRTAVPTGSERVLGRDCDVFLFKAIPTGGPTPTDFVYCLDRTTGVPLKVSRYPDEAARKEAKPYSVWQAESLDQVEGHWMPLKSEATKYTYGPGGQKVLYTRKAVIDELHYNRDYPATTFWPVSQPGVRIFDTINSSSEKVPGGPQTTSAVAQTPSGTPIQATQPRNWMSSLPYVGLGLGAVLVVVGFIHWRRRRA